MFRAVVLSIVLTLAAGPSAALLCRMLCDPQAAATDGCHHTTAAASTSVASQDTCDDRGLSVAGFVREDVRRCGPAPERHCAVSVPRYHLADATTDDSFREIAWPESSLEKRPLSTNLRI
jgi:hypothetical protein